MSSPVPSKQLILAKIQILAKVLADEQLRKVEWR
jgi:hypothetical protein